MICRHLIVLFLHLYCVSDVVSGQIVVELKPDDPFVYFDDRLELTCTASDSVADRLLLFRGSDVPIDDQFLQKVNNSTVHVRLPITEKDKDIKTYLCLLDDYSSLSTQDLKMEYRPRPVENFTCEIYNWEILTCTWDSGPYINWNEIHVSATWKHAMMFGNFNVTDDKLKFSVDFMFYSYNFTITVTHSQDGKQDVTVSKTFDRPNITVKPAAVNNLQIISEEDQCVTLKYEHVRYPIRELKFRVTYSSKWELHPLHHWVLKNDTMTVCNLHPYSKYKFDVDVLPIQNDGVWSNIESVEYTTKPIVPGSGPPSTNGSYYQDLCENGKRMVTTFFQHVSERFTNGIMESYTAVYTPLLSGGQLISTGPSTTFSIDQTLSCSTDYVVELKATNNFGTSTNNTFLYIPKQEPIPFERDARLYVTVIKETNISDRHIVARWSEFESRPLYYKLFWCQSSSFRSCQDNIKWVEVEGYVTSIEIPSDSLNIEDVEARKYIFSISAVYKRNISTPMIFANCIYQSWTVPKDQPHLQLDKENPVRSLRLSWKYETCPSQALVYIQYFNIYHCPIDENGNCTAKYDTETVDSRINNYQLTDLKAETNYSVWMQPVSPGGLGPESEKLYGVPSESGELTPSEISGIVFGIVVGMALIFFIISRLFCRKYWDTCCKKYVIKEIKKEVLTPVYVDIDNLNEINPTKTPTLETQMSKDSGTFSQSTSEREHLPSVSEHVSDNPRIMARSVSDVFNEPPNGQLLPTKDSTEMITVITDGINIQHLPSGIANLHTPSQSSIHKDSKPCSATASSSSSTQHCSSQSTDGVSVPPYTQWTCNSSQSQQSNEEVGGQPCQTMLKINNACSSSDYVDHSSLNNLSESTSTDCDSAPPYSHLAGYSSQCQASNEVLKLDNACSSTKRQNQANVDSVDSQKPKPQEVPQHQNPNIAESQI